MADPYKYFRPEASEILDQFSRGMLELEKGAGASTVQRLLRLAHTLKGAARVVKQSEIATHAHAIEDAFSPLRDAPEKIGRKEIDIVLERLDAIGALLRTLGQPEQSNDSVAGNKVEEVARTIRADVTEADAMLDSIAEVRALMSGLRLAASTVDQAGQEVQALIRALNLPSTVNASGKAGNGAPIALAETVLQRIGAIERTFDFAVDRVDRELRQLREAAERLRMVPASSLFTALERTARDTARALGKEVSFSSTSDDVRLDAHVLEVLERALIQIVRNAVAHGVELPPERTAAGKPQAGNIAVTVVHRGRQIVFSCSDDGRGLDFERVRSVAQQHGLIERGRELGSDELVRILLRGGVSTSRTVTEQSGRGIGLDVVREAIERLGGEVACRSTPGRGTLFELIIPPSLAAMEALLIEGRNVGGVMAIPLTVVSATRRIAASEISLTPYGASILHDGRAIPFITLAAAIDRAAWSSARNWTIVVVNASNGAAAIAVDRLLGTSSIVMLPLPQRMKADPAVSAAFLDADGNPQLVLDADRLVEAAQRGAVRVDSVAPQVPVLVVDDSLTTRMLEQSILESAGYEVETAVSGEDALECVHKKKFALILVDVEMPGMDGFTFIERIRADTRTRDIPAILVTSLSEPAYRQRGRDVGAQGYLVKSEFNQAELLSMIKPLVN